MYDWGSDLGLGSDFMGVYYPDLDPVFYSSDRLSIRVSNFELPPIMVIRVDGSYSS